MTVRGMANSITIKHQYPLREHNTFGMEVKVRQFISYYTIDELVAVLAHLRGSDERILHIGGGSNLLFTKDFEGTVLHSFNKLSIQFNGPAITMPSSLLMALIRIPPNLASSLRFLSL